MRMADAAPRPGDVLECETEDSRYDVRVLRGPVVEKFGRMLVENWSAAQEEWPL